MFDKLKSKLLKQNIEITFTQNSISELAELGYDPVYGARPLRRAIQNHIEDLVADKILGSELLPGVIYEVDYSHEFTIQEK